MISWGQLLSYSDSKSIRTFDFSAIIGTTAGSFGEFVVPFGFTFHLPWIYYVWFIGGAINLAGVLACYWFSPPAIRLYRSSEKYVDAQRLVATKSHDDDLEYIRRESSAVSAAIFSALSIELDGVQKKSISDRLFDHFNSKTAHSLPINSSALERDWARADLSWTWRKALVTLLFGFGILAYLGFGLFLIVKGWHPALSHLK